MALIFSGTLDPCQQGVQERIREPNKRYVQCLEPGTRLCKHFGALVVEPPAFVGDQRSQMCEGAQMRQACVGDAAEAEVQLLERAHGLTLRQLFEKRVIHPRGCRVERTKAPAQCCGSGQCAAGQKRKFLEGETGDAGECGEKGQRVVVHQLSPEHGLRDPVAHCRYLGR